MRAYILFSCMTILSMLFAQLAASAGQANEFEDIAREAFKASIQSTQSAHGKGVYQIHKRDENGLFVLEEEADVGVWFDKGKYKVVLAFTKSATITAKQIFICDGVSMMHSDFWKDVRHPTGAEGYVEEAIGEVHQPMSPSFPWDVSCLPKQILNTEKFFAGTPKKNVTWLRVGKNIQGSYNITDESVFQFTLSEDFGFNAFELTVTNKGEARPVQHVKSEWKRIEGQWFVTTIADELNLRGSSERKTLTLKEFTPGVTIAASEFTLDALELPENSRILDQRPNATERSYYYVRTAKTEAKLVNLLDQVQKLPVKRPPGVVGGLPLWLRHFLLWVLLALSVVCFSLVGLRWWRRRRKVSPTQS
jgi:hypothetical protein